MDASAFASLDPCVHCGFCLPACPTYLATGDEADSPRGRIVLMRALERGEIEPLDTALTQHLDACLGCRGCEPACPSGVGYGEGLAAARTMLTKARGIPAIVRAFLAVMRFPALWRLAFGAGTFLRHIGLAEALAGPIARRLHDGHARRDRAPRKSRARARAACPCTDEPLRRAPPPHGCALPRLHHGHRLPPRERGHQAHARGQRLSGARGAGAGVLRCAARARLGHGGRGSPRAGERGGIRRSRRFHRHQQRRPAARCSRSMATCCARRRARPSARACAT
jgi:glycolate oxidase iron-sulfur subunit